MENSLLLALVIGLMIGCVGGIVAIAGYLWLTKDSDVGEDEFRQAFINSEDNSK